MPTYYRLNFGRLSYRELAGAVRWYQLPFVCLAKLLRVPIGGSADFPAVDSVAPFETDESSVPDAVRELMASRAEELSRLGFHSPLWHIIPDPPHNSQSIWATYLHSGGRAIARVSSRVWSIGGKSFSSVHTGLCTPLDDGTYQITGTQRSDVQSPAALRVVTLADATSAALWDRHQKDVNDHPHARPVPVTDQAHMRQIVERVHEMTRDDLGARGVLQPLPEEQQPDLAAAAHTATAGDDGPVYFELTRLQNEKANWSSTLLIFIASLLMFTGAARGGADLSVWMLVPILLFHELGHFVAMKLFGYRNLKMFFIPFFGAAVSGRHYNVAGWKKAVVALAGPVPGIFAGGAIGAVGWVTGKPDFMLPAAMTIGLNAFNLLPLLPLDGGWLMHAVVFARHPVLDAAFRLAAVASLSLVAWLLGAYIMFILPAILLIGLPLSWTISQIARKLRCEGVGTVSPDAQTIPPETAARILTELRTAIPKMTDPKVLAANVASVFENLNTRPPGFLASLLLLGTYAASVVAAVVLFVLVAVGGPAKLWELIFDHGRPSLPVVPEFIQEWRGPGAFPRAPEGRTVLVATFADATTARAEFESLPAELPRTAVLNWFGRSLILTLPEAGDAERANWAGRLRRSAAEVIEDRKDNPAWVRVYGTAADPEEAGRTEAELREYLHAPNCSMLIPPWSPQWAALPEGDRGRYRKARQTVDRLQLMAAEARDTPEARRQQEIVAKAAHDGDIGKLGPAMQALDRAAKAEQARLLDSLRPDLDPLITELWEKAARHPDEQQPQRDAALAELAARMGRLPADGDPTAARHGAVRRQGILLTLDSLSFRDPGAGLAALARWLAGRGCVDLHYNIDPGINEEETDEP